VAGHALGRTILIVAEAQRKPNIEVVPDFRTGCQGTPDLKGWYGNEENKEALLRGFQG